MDQHEALVNSLGEHCVDYIGKGNLSRLTIALDHANGVAHVEICLQDDSWTAREKAIDAMVDVRLMFLDEVSVDYAFADNTSCGELSEAPVEYAYA